MTFHEQAIVHETIVPETTASLSSSIKSTAESFAAWVQSCADYWAAANLYDSLHRLSAVGALGGITGPLAAFPGAFVTIWCGMRGLDKVVQRSIYQPYILVLQVLTLGGLSLVGERSMLNAEAAAYALPGLAGAYLGLHVFQKLTDAQFQKLVNLALILSGIALAVK